MWDNFEFLNPTNLETASYVFPSRNAAVFVENLFNINENLVDFKRTLFLFLNFQFMFT